MNGLLSKNVIITSMELGGIGWFTSILSEIHKYMFGHEIPWRYEISRFEATRARRPLPKGWCTVWNALPSDLVKRKFDKVLGLQKNLQDAYYAHFLYKYHYDKTYEWMLDNQPWYFNTVKNNWFRLERPIKSEKYKKFNLDDLNTFTVETFTKVLDFLDFPKEGRPFIIPVKAYRNWESYSNITHGKEHEVSDNLKRINELYLSDVRLNGS